MNRTDHVQKVAVYPGRVPVKCCQQGTVFVNVPRIAFARIASGEEEVYVGECSLGHTRKFLLVKDTHTFT